MSPATRPPVAPPEYPGARFAWDESLAALAAKQHGVVSRAQLLACGLTPKAIRHRVKRARLHEIHPGVYAVGHRLLSPRGWWMAAVLYGGEDAVLSHRAAAALHGLIDGSPSRIDILVLRTVARRRGVRPRRVRSIPAEDRATVDRIPCTSVARTLLDLASEADERTVDRALRRAEDRRVFDRFELERILKRSRPGTLVLRTAMAVFAGDEQARRKMKHELELRFMELLRRHRFVLPSTNVIVVTPWKDHEVDTLWPDERIVIELDGWWTHRDRESFRRDHARSADLRATGYSETRLSWDQVVEQEAATVERLARFLPRLKAPATGSASAEDAVGDPRPPRVPGR